MTEHVLSKKEAKQSALELWRSGFSPREIIDYLELDNSIRCVQQWQDEWKKAEDYCAEQAIFAADAEIRRLIQKQQCTALDLKKLQILKDLVATADTNRTNLKAKAIKPVRVKEAASGGGETDKPDRKSSAGKRLHKNSIDHITPEMFERFEQRLFHHQKISLAAAFDSEVNAMRLILKPRQAGQTYIEAYIAFKRAVLEGDAHSFLSATIPQAMTFNGYIKDIAANYFDCEIFEGTKKIVLKKENKNWGSFEFISSKVFSAQGRAAHVIFDECAWVIGFAKVDDVANAMATQDGYTLTYLSTPSTTQHDFYEYWTGERYNKYQPPHAKVDIDVKTTTFLKLNQGRLDGDGFWRYLYTIDSVLENDPSFPYTIEKLQKRCPNPRTFDCIYRAVWTDDNGSEFSIKSLLRCLVPDDEWAEYVKSTHKVGAGYDPSSGSETSGDEAAIAYLELPDKSEDAFRLLYASTFETGTAESHVQHFLKRKKSYEIKHFFVDVSGSGVYLWTKVKDKVANASRVTFNVEKKTAMVLKMHDLIRQKRFLFHEDMKHEVIASFMSIKKGFTQSTKQITYYSTRSNTASGGKKHGELFWCVAMVCDGVEGLNYENANDEVYMRAV